MSIQFILHFWSKSKLLSTGSINCLICIHSSWTNQGSIFALNLLWDFRNYQWPQKIFESFNCVWILASGQLLWIIWEKRWLFQVRLRSRFRLISARSYVQHPTPIILYPRTWQIAFKSRVDQYICQCFPPTALNGISEKKGNEFQQT